MERTLPIALAGAGAIARALIDGIDRGLAGAIRIDAIGCLPAEIESVTALAEPRGSRVTTDLETLPAGARLVIEAAGQDVVRRYASGWLERGADVMVLSAGALVDPEALATLRRTALAQGRRIFVPSGAIAAVDGIRAATLGGLRRLRLRTTKPPRGLAGAPYVEAHAIDLDALDTATTIFEGGVADAVRGFPSNVNVAAVLQLAAGGSAELAVSVVADPHVTTNIHEIEASGDFGTFTIRLDNVPSPLNPKTSALAPLSALAMLRRLTEPVWIGA